MNRFKRWATWFLAFALVVGGGIAVFWQINFYRVYDASWQPLVMTERESFCAGLYGISNRFIPDDPDVIQCMEDFKGELGDTPDVGRAVYWSCAGIISGGWPGPMDECQSIFEGSQLWLVVGGGLTNDWNSGHPRPRPEDSGILPADPGRSDSRGDIGPSGPATDTESTTTTTDGEEGE